MHPTLENFLQKPKKDKLLAAFGIVAVLCFLFWQFSYSAKLAEQEEAQAKVDELDKNIQAERRKAANLTKLREEVKDLDMKLKFALQELPDRSEIPELLDSISNLARDAGLEITLFKPNQEVVKDFYAEVPVSISVDGSFHQVATFFDEVGHLSRIVNIREIYIHDSEVTNDAVKIKVDCVATTFRYLDEEERARAAADKAAKEKANKRK